MGHSMLIINRYAFFELVRAGLWEKEARLLPFGKIDYEEVMRLAEEQSVVGLVSAGLEHVVDSKVPKEEVLQFVGRTLQLEQRNSAMNKFVGELVEEMRKAGIYTLLLKGQGIAQCYERPLWRTCGDVDFFLSEENYKKAKEFLFPKATTVKKEYTSEQHLGMEIGRFEVELHGTLYSGLSTSIEKGLDELKRAAFNEGNVRSWMNGRTQIFLLKPSEDVIYVFTHILQHFYKGGIGLRQICDWCRSLWTYRSELDLRLLESRIKRMGLMSEWKAFGYFAVEYLGMPTETMPFYSSKEKWKRKADKICAFILEVGNMGHNRDTSYSEKYPYPIRKIYSFGRRCSDLVRHTTIFPMDSVRFFPRIMFNGMRSVVKGEG